MDCWRYVLRSILISLCCILHMMLMRFQRPEAVAILHCCALSITNGRLLQIVKKPDQKLLAALLGVAIGVMGSLSLLELLIRNALDHGIFAVSFSMTLGLATYHLLQPYLPDFDKSLQTANQDQVRISVCIYLTYQHAVTNPYQSPVRIALDHGQTEECGPQSAGKTRVCTR